jgi:hypothetical protein
MIYAIKKQTINSDKTIVPLTYITAAAYIA